MTYSSITVTLLGGAYPQIKTSVDYNNAVVFRILMNTKVSSTHLIFQFQRSQGPKDILQWTIIPGPQPLDCSTKATLHANLINPMCIKLIHKGTYRHTVRHTDEYDYDEEHHDACKRQQHEPYQPQNTFPKIKEESGFYSRW